MAREKPKEAGVPEWILTYGDMMSLLLCFFIMLYSMSIIATIKFEAVVESLQKNLGYSGSSRTPSRSNKTSSQRSVASERANRLAALTGGQPIVSAAGEHKNVQTFRIKEERIKGGIIRFDLGSDVLSTQAKQDIDAVLSTLVGSPFKIMIKGHAAPYELQGPYQQDIDLSYARAVNVRDYLISRGLKAKFFQLAVVGSHEPLNRAVLPPGMDPKTVNSIVEIILLDKTVRNLQDNSNEDSGENIPIQ
ncbi:MAG: OmpA family protein [Planctomycetaceae bacterium]|jgi:chemotaxis protein MotB|nr:OmpA family protein [Planctomycetaceae bacterium]